MTLDERTQATLDRLDSLGLLPREAPVLPPILTGETEPVPKRTPCSFGTRPDGSTLYSLYQSEDHSLRLYVTYDKDAVPTYSFTASFLNQAPWPMVDPDEPSLDKEWANLVHQYRLGHDMGYLKQKLLEAGMVGAMRVAEGFHEGRVTNERQREAARTFDEQHPNRQEAVAVMLERTAAKVRAHRGGFLIHEISEVDDPKGFAVGCSVHVTGYMGG